MQLFGFNIGRNKKQDDEDRKENLVSFAPNNDHDGTAVVNASVGGGAGYFGTYVDIDGVTIGNEKELILRYRGAAAQPECDSAITDITNAAIVSEEDSAPVSLITRELEFSEEIKEKIQEEFENVVSLYNFSEEGDDYFRRWYIDGRIYFHLIPDPDNIKNGLKEVREIDPLKIKKIREVTTEIDQRTGVKTIKTSAEYFTYTDTNFLAGGTAVGEIRIKPDAIVYVPSGLLDETRKQVISYLHKSLRIVNQLRMMEDAMVIYRISRAPERRIFYIDVGNLPKGKAEEYVQSIMSKYRNKLVYDASTGNIRSDTRSMSMLEDFFLPRREGSRGTEISTLPGGSALGEVSDVEWFKNALYRSLNVPLSRMNPDTGFNIGRSSEITREELKFHKMVSKLRKKFSYLLINTLRVQLLLKGIITEEDWDQIKENISVRYQEDNYFTELKEFEILRERMSALNEVASHIGTYYSKKWVRENILKQTEQEIEILDKEMASEEESMPDDEDLDA